jgi:hypothetical protein
MGMPVYDKRAEVTVTGPVEDIREMTGMSGMTGGSMRDMHLMIKKDRETFEVHLGPVTYLKEQKSTSPRATRSRSAAHASRWEAGA